jgi:predicted nucleic acid-binding protein
VILDTSVFVGIETARLAPTDIDGLDASVSVITSAELELGVHQATDPTERARRLRTLRFVDQTFDLLPVDRAVASAFSALAAQLKRDGRAVPIMDALIGATAIANGLKVVTQDQGFRTMPGVDVELI